MPPFMAIEALITPKNVEFAHLPSHDLESILYVILYICTFTQGPCQSLCLDFDVPESLYMKSWFSTDSVDVISFCKVGHMSQPEQTIIPGFMKYWENFIPYALELI
jgi:Fungal protein kinase